MQPRTPHCLTRPTDVRALLTELELKPSRMLGQNFLIDANMLRILTDAARIAPGDHVLEIGPGLGVLTESLLACGARVTAIEKDKRLHAWLQRRIDPSALFALQLADATDVDLPSLFQQGIRALVSNLPYSVGSRILMECFQTPHRPERMVVTVQKEVADRIGAATGTKAYGLLGVWAQIGYRVRLHKTIPGSCFLPAPDVASAIVVLERLPEPRVPDAHLTAFRDIVRTGFGQRRKQLGSLLGDPRPLAAAGLEASARAETLSPDDWARLAAYWTAR